MTPPNETKMPDIPDKVMLSFIQGVMFGNGEHEYTRTSLLEQRAKLAAEKIIDYYIDHADTGAYKEELTSIIIQTLKGDK